VNADDTDRPVATDEVWSRPMTSRLEWPRKLAIVGTGLLGASVGLAARAARVPEVVGADNDRPARSRRRPTAPT
jgi:hypothetical protein